MKTLQLTKGQVATVDDDDYEKVSRWKWCAEKQGCTFYACRSEKKDGVVKHIYLHRQIMRAVKGDMIDHKNGNGLDCQKENLRFCNQSQNNQNARLFISNTSGAKGVVWDKANKKWMARITSNKRTFHLGRFLDFDEARRTCEAKRSKLHGEFQRIK